MKLTEKKCVLINSVQDFVEINLIVSDLFHMLTQSIEVYTFYCHILQMCRCLNKVIDQIDRKISSSFYGKI